MSLGFRRVCRLRVLTTACLIGGALILPLSTVSALGLADEVPDLPTGSDGGSPGVPDDETGADCWGWGWFQWCGPEVPDDQQDQAAPSDESDDGDEEPADEHKLFSEAEAAQFAARLLADAGVTDYKLLAGDENPLQGFDVVWGYPNGIMGGVAGYKNMQDVELDDAVAVIIEDDEAICGGQFSSGKLPSEPIGGVEVRRLYTRCKSSDHPMEIHYTLFKTETGHVIQLAHIAYGDTPDEAALSQADAPFLQPSVVAAMQ